MTYIKPQVLIHEEFAQSTDGAESVLRAVIVGPNAKLHRYSDPDEKDGIDCGEYKFGKTNEFVIPDHEPGGVVDKDTAKLFIDNALFSYYDKLDQSSLTPEQASSIVFYNEPGTPNIIRGNGFNFVANGTAYPRNSSLGIRDVQVGDYVWVQGYVSNPSDGGCNYITHTSKIIDFAPEATSSSIGAVTDPSETIEAVTYEVDEDYAETTNTPSFTLDATDYDALASGVFTPNYVITISKVDQTAACDFAVYANISSANGFDNKVDIPIYPGVEFEIGSYKMKGTFSATNFTKLQAGDKVTITGTSAYTKAEVESEEVPGLVVGGNYTGNITDTYIVTVVKGGDPSDSDTAKNPILEVKTSNGNDYSVFPVSGEDPLLRGGNGLTFKLLCPVYTGQQFSFVATAAGNGAICGLVLQNDLPADLRTLSANSKKPLDLRLLVRKDSTLTEGSESNPNFEFEDNKVTVNPITTTDPEFLTNNLEEITLTLFSGEMFFEYREWLPTTAGEINYCDSISGLDLIPGQLDPNNPLKYGVYKALGSSNGVSVGYVGVADPTDNDSWDDAFGVIEGVEDVYTVVPLTQDIVIINKAKALIELESGAEQCRWKTGMFCLQLAKERMVVGQNTVNNDLMETSTDGKVTTIMFKNDNPEDLTSFKQVELQSDNADFIEYGVKPGDKLRIPAGSSYTEYVVDVVVSDKTLLTTTGPSAASVAPVKAEVWHTMTKLEQANYYGELAQSLVSRRISVIAPDKVGEGGQVLPGYYVAAGIAGTKSGINAYQSLTRTEVTGFDDFSASKPYWTESQLNTLASHGVMIVVEDSNGTPYIRHGLTTDMSDTFHQEESITRDFDYVCKTLHSVLQNFIGRVTITDESLSSIETAMEATLDSLRGSKHIRDYSDVVVRQHALLADRVEVYANVTLPFPMNNIEVYVTAQRG